MLLVGITVHYIDIFIHITPVDEFCENNKKEQYSEVSNHVVYLHY